MSELIVALEMGSGLGLLFVKMLCDGPGFHPLNLKENQPDLVGLRVVIFGYIQD